MMTKRPAARHGCQRALIVIAVGVVLCGVLAGIAAADAPQEPRHGINESTFHALWSHEPPGEVDAPETEAEAVRNTTDVPFSEPPAAVEEWNTDEIDRFPAGDSSTSVHPPGADREDGQWIRDAHVSLFSVQPSTRAYIAPGDQRFYIPSNGSALGTADYRISVPPDTSSGSPTTRRVSWSIVDHDIESVDVRYDSGLGELETIGSAESPGHTFDIPYEGVFEDGDIGLEATISVTLEKHIETRSCSPDGDGGHDCTPWSSSFEYPSETVTAEAWQSAQHYSVLTSGFFTQFPNDDMGIVVQRDIPWHSVTMPSGDQAMGIWRYYSGRDTEWDTLQETTSSGSESVSSPVKPLQVHAVPYAETDATLSTDSNSGIGRGEITHRSGEEYDVPDLPEPVELIRANGSYTMSQQLAIRHPEYDPSAVQVNGIVRGERENVSLGLYSFTETREPSIEAEVLDNGSAADNVAELRITVVDDEGEPVETAGYRDELTIRGMSFQTNESGQAIVEVDRRQLPATVEYQADRYWERSPGYVETSQMVTTDAQFPDVIQPLLTVLVVLALGFMPFYVLNRLFDADFWPPWREIW